MIIYYVSLLEQFCTDSVNVYERGSNEIGDDRLAIIQPHNFACNGRIISIRARVSSIHGRGRNSYPSFQVWRPTSVSSTVYNKIGEVQLQSDDQVNVVRGSILVATVILTGTNTIEVQSGDVVGYYHPPDARYRVRTIQTDGYRLYQFRGSRDSVDLNNIGSTNQQQPLIQLTVGK